MVAIVGTKAACQTLGHLAKIALFGLAGFAFIEWAGPIGLMSVGVVFGTWIGTRLLDRVDERAFTTLYRSVLTGIALWLIARNGFAALSG